MSETGCQVCSPASLDNACMIVAMSTCMASPMFVCNTYSEILPFICFCFVDWSFVFNVRTDVHLERCHFLYRATSDSASLLCTPVLGLRKLVPWSQVPNIFKPLSLAAFVVEIQPSDAILLPGFTCSESTFEILAAPLGFFSSAVSGWSKTEAATRLVPLP